MCWLHYQLLGELFQSADFVGTDLSMATCQANYELLLYCITMDNIVHIYYPWYNVQYNYYDSAIKTFHLCT